MKISFITPRKKSVISGWVRIWIITLIIVEVLVFMVNILLKSQASTYEERIKANLIRKNRLENQLKDLYKRERLMKREATLARRMRNSNTKLRSKIQRIFELVPKEVIFKKVIWSSDSLLLEGYTPKKSDFNFVLQTELDQLYGVSKTVFFRRKGGGFNFSSKNISKERQIENRLKQLDGK